jgi:hypothetical protein
VPPGKAQAFIDNLPIGQFYDIAVDARDPYWIYGGAQDNGTWGVPSRSYAKVGITNMDVVNIAYGDGFQAAVAPRDPRVTSDNHNLDKGKYIAYMLYPCGKGFYVYAYLESPNNTDSASYNNASCRPGYNMNYVVGHN